MVKITPIEIKDIDDTPLTFGKHSGSTPNDLMEQKEYSYLVWLYENMDEPPISEELYEEADIENAFEEDRPSW